MQSVPKPSNEQRKSTLRHDDFQREEQLSLLPLSPEIIKDIQGLSQSASPAAKMTPLSKVVYYAD